MPNKRAKVEAGTDFLFLVSKIAVDFSDETKRLTPWNDKPREHIKKQRHHFADKGLYSQSYGFSSTHVRMWELDQKKAECWRTDAFELWCEEDYW